MEEAKKMIYKRLIYKQFFKLSSLSEPQFLSYLPKHFTHLCRALYGDANLTNMASGNQQKHLEFTFSINALPFHSRASISAHKHIFKYLKWLNCWKSRGETFLQRDSIPILVSRTVKTREVQITVCSKWNMLRGWKLVQTFIFYFSSIQPSVNKNS